MPTNLTGTTIASTFDQLLHVDEGPAATEKTVYSGTGVATALKVGTLSASVDNIQLDGNTIATTNTNGNLVLAPNGTGVVTTDNISLSGNAITVTDTNGNLVLSGNGTGSVSMINAAITGGTISGVTFTGSFTGLTSISSETLIAGNLTMDDNSISANNTNGDIKLNPNGTGEVIVSKPFGYGGTGVGGAVTQGTSRTTAVTLNKVSGRITMFASTAIPGLTSNEFTLNNSFIDPDDVIVACFASGLTSAQYSINATVVSSGSCKIAVHNVTNTATAADTPVINFAIIKAVAA